MDDDPGARDQMTVLLQTKGCSVAVAPSGKEAIDYLSHRPAPALIILDLLMPGADGFETLVEVRKMCPQLRIVVVSCLTDAASIVRAVRLGADDYLTKPLDELGWQRVIAHQFVSTALSSPHEEPIIEDLGPNCFFFGYSAEMRKIWKQISLLATVDVPVLVVGESGTGKEIVCKLIHRFSLRQERPFLKVNCAAIPQDLLESELFGYEAGAFTGAIKPKPGKFELCDGGTLLLDEIGELSPGLQAKLLQVVQERKFSRLGSRSSITADVRILGATNLNIADALRTGKLRLDLYYRLGVLVIRVPPLRDRKEAIPYLFDEFMRRLAARYHLPTRPWTEVLAKACDRYQWPGNVRELENLVSRYLILGNDQARASELHSSLECRDTEVHANSLSESGDLKGIVKSLKGQAEAELITRALEETGWSRSKAANRLHISYKALTYKIRMYGIRISKPPYSVLPTSGGDITSK